MFPVLFVSPKYDGNVCTGVIRERSLNKTREYVVLIHHFKPFLVSALCQNSVIFKYMSYVQTLSNILNTLKSPLRAAHLSMEHIKSQDKVPNSCRQCDVCVLLLHRTTLCVHDVYVTDAILKILYWSMH